MEMKKVEVKMNKPIYLGQAVLDMSKILMYVTWIQIALLWILKQMIFTMILIMM